MRLKISFSKLLLHLILLVAFNAALILLFFSFYLPMTTHHGEAIIVPDLKGMPLEDVIPFLEKKSLKAVVNDSTHESTFPPLVILEQNPAPNSEVKQNRSIYLIINSQLPPRVKMPKLVDLSVRSAQITLESYGLKIGKTTFVPDIAQNAVLEQQYNGKTIEPGEFVPGGCRIDLILGDGLGDEEIEVPYLIGYPFKEAKSLLLGMGLSTGSVEYNEEATEKAGTIISQKPDTSMHNKIHLGEMIDFIIAGKEPESK